ncbi:hypothetical protein [Candidatus Pyrohabitans sp.]
MALEQVLRLRLSREQVQKLTRGHKITEILPSGEVLEITAEVGD